MAWHSNRLAIRLINGTFAAKFHGKLAMRICFSYMCVLEVVGWFVW